MMEDNPFPPNSVEYAIREVLDLDKPDSDVVDLATAVRVWAKENADVPELAGYLARGSRIKPECSCGECEPVWTGDFRSAVSLDKFGDDE
jgi:hypothetical protein